MPIDFGPILSLHEFRWPQSGNAKGRQTKATLFRPVAESPGCGLSVRVPGERLAPRMCGARGRMASNLGNFTANTKIAPGQILTARAKPDAMRGCFRQRETLAARMCWSKAFRPFAEVLGESCEPAPDLTAGHYMSVTVGAPVECLFRVLHRITRHSTLILCPTIWQCDRAVRFLDTACQCIGSHQFRTHGCGVSLPFGS